MCNCVRKCVSFLGYPQFVVILPVKRFAGDSRVKIPMPSHKKHPHEILPLHSCQFAISRASDHQILPRRSLQIENCFGVRLKSEAFGTAARARPSVVFHRPGEEVREGHNIVADTRFFERDLMASGGYASTRPLPFRLSMDVDEHEVR
jgi:hypothetical protein